MTLPKIAQNLKSFSNLFSDESLAKKAYLNAMTAALDYGARLLVGFILTPLLVAGLGDYSYGAWRILGRLIGYISPASGRPTQALKWTLASQQASTDYEEKRRHVGSTVVVWLLFLPLLAALGGLLAWFAPSWLNTPVEFSWSVRLATGLLVANLVMTSLVAVPRSVLEGENLGYKRMGLSAILVFVGGGFTALALYFDTGLVGVAAATLATTLLTGALFLQVVRTYAPWFGVARPSFEAARQFLGLSWWFLGWNLVMKLMMASDVIVLGMLDSVELVTTYSVTKYAPETLISLVAIVVFGITPGLGGIIGSGDLQRAARVRSEIMSFTWLMTTVVGATILLWDRVFVQLWVEAEYYAGSVPTLLITVMMIQFILIRNDANIIDLTLNLPRKVLIGALSATLSLVVAGVLVSSFKAGITGICLGFMVGRSILSLGYPLMVGRFLGVSLNSQLKGVLRPAFVTVLLFSLASKLGNFLTASGWVGLVLSVVVTLGVVLLLAFFAGLSGNQRRHILRRVRMVVASASA
jgi:O-antigen/teichoic acid export membrane protein